MTDVTKQTFQHIFEKIVANNNKFPPKEIENFRSLLENVRDRDQKNFNMIMEKLKSWDHIENDLFREGMLVVFRRRRFLGENVIFCRMKEKKL